MAYQIQYGETAMHITLENRSTRKKPLRYSFLLPVLTVLFLVYLLNTGNVRDFLIPGDKEITKAAWSQMNQSLAEGEPFTDAFRTFCREVVQKGDLA